MTRCQESAAAEHHRLARIVEETVASTLPALLGATNRILDEGALMRVTQSVVSIGQMLGPLLGYGALLVPPPRGAKKEPRGD
jgi:hypothetical protein